MAVEVQNIESKGGMQTADGSRRRTPGGVFWALFKQRVSQEVYEDVFAEEKEKARERQRKRKSVQRTKEADGEQDMDTSMSPPSTVEKAMAPSSSPSWAAVAKTPATIKVKASSNNVVEDLTEELPSYERWFPITRRQKRHGETMAAKLFKSNNNSGFFKPGKEKQDSMFGGKEKQDARQQVRPSRRSWTWSRRKRL